jgi:hypothetical protein
MQGSWHAYLNLHIMSTNIAFSTYEDHWTQLRVIEEEEEEIIWGKKCKEEECE